MRLPVFFPYNSYNHLDFRVGHTVMKIRRFMLAILIGVALCIPLGRAVSADAKPSGFDEREALAASEASIGSPLGRYAFIDSKNQVRALNSFVGHPLVISLIYTGCADVCPTVSEQLANAVEIAQETFGTDAFNVVTIGFDAQNDTPARMRSFAVSHGLTLDNWYFLSGDQATIERFANDLGFVFFTSAAGFEHMTRTTIIDAEGVVYRHLYGANIEPPHLMEPMKDLIYGRKGNTVSLDGIINKVRLFCTIYDAREGRYRFDYSIFISMSAGLLAFFGLGFILIRAWLANRRDARRS